MRIERLAVGGSYVEVLPVCWLWARHCVWGAVTCEYSVCLLPLFVPGRAQMEVITDIAVIDVEK
jgi:hypothetical protein